MELRTHDLVITVSSVNGTGGITGTTQTGTAPDAINDQHRRRQH